MKKIQFISTLFLSLFFLSACNEQDTLDDVVIVGNMAPHVYWELGSSTVTAGNNVPFIIQYYTTGKAEIDHMEVWYNIIEDESKTVACPWTQTFTYSISQSKTIEKRISQKVTEYAHNQSYWLDSLHAYSFKSTFPTSNTLTGVTWQKPSTFDSDKMVKYYGSNFMKQFKDSLYKMMKVADFQKMYLGLNLVDNFKPYLDSIPNKNTGGYDYVFPKDASGNRPVPTAIASIYETIPFADLIYNKTTSCYDVEYSRSYWMQATVRAYDRNGIFGLGLSQKITLN